MVVESIGHQMDTEEPSDIAITKETVISMIAATAILTALIALFFYVGHSRQRRPLRRQQGATGRNFPAASVFGLPALPTNTGSSRHHSQLDLQEDLPEYTPLYTLPACPPPAYVPVGRQC